MTKKLTINKVRGGLYRTARILGDVQAVRSPKKGAIQRRILRRIVGKLLGRWVLKLI